jgi:hypothetical protein
MMTYDSKATQAKACKRTMRKKNFAHFDARNSDEKRAFLRAALGGTPEAIMALSL